MVGLLFIALILGLWLLATAISEEDLFCGIDLSYADLVVGEGYARWLCAVAGCVFVLIGLMGLVV
jgi:hypothetical protein